MKHTYDKEVDILNIQLEEKPSWECTESGNFILDFDKEGDLIGIEVRQASKVFTGKTKKILEEGLVENKKSLLAKA
ncbi:MAG: DUF2283 domain-containing protein [Candidatus Woesearchaeota archaeon]|nr:DUF2283 domain-containing protein [Candidatus Woesearchaeota archaeon]MDP7181056.1 DUF2283 domain-containing protein [Candidatus Woesearchaeota archaeon]MDP7198323.1 DUF2283 domain-containing protein [Candidatus Woesearchaeota archaeon]MDP7467425.1 DUF2283 domain-containing protein [Candidatus Woesearchaeota archaeon]MDP7647652.1 DUF2283 domain-containing protein [Candidatus Woesearchaeota archaeon]